MFFEKSFNVVCFIKPISSPSFRVPSLLMGEGEDEGESPG
jgi:hypothetical protein